MPIPFIIRICPFSRTLVLPNLNKIDLDFRLLTIFQVLMKTRKVGAAADQLNIPQPTISRALGRLREHFGDPLFVRTQQAMEPTPCALEISPHIEEILELYHSSLSQQKEFDPRISKRTFRIAASEIGHMLLLPGLVNTLTEQALEIKLEAVPLGLHSLIEELETGQVDVAFGAFPKLYAGVYERTLAKENYVCISRSKHPLAKKNISLDGYRQADHVIVSVQGLGHIHEQIERQLLNICPRENVKVISHHFLTTILLVEQTNLIATLPSRAVKALSEQLDIQVFEPPIDIPSFDIKTYWHERFHRDAANQWLRDMIGREIRTD